MVVILSLFTMQTVLDAYTHSRPPWYWGVQNPTFLMLVVSLIPPLWLSHQHNDISNLNSSVYLFYISFVFILFTTNTWGTQSKHSLDTNLTLYPQLYKHLLNKIKENLFLDQVLSFKILHRNSDWLIHSKIYEGPLCFLYMCNYNWFYKFIWVAAYKFLSSFQKGYKAIQSDFHLIFPRKLS